ncbi:MAG: DNA-binding response regulator [Microbacterium sp. 14-71-5]|jgi:DNA-binding NarL/FixJ family response regulator|uniref:response regulator n=1 Tax=Microbacterium sp. 13-71-7 TaxID=1970399 RepID=UPI000BD986BD|nr:response regulator transcription factor [Microbacterium sp. 13-71-7]OZB86285.1 MAG: DNA-binding response regulator [Microbacterium sp. 13-71-7]OZB87594.1 MAG: DNA-binding response regulator [Microbacterium sp. 14-71-5]
MTLRIVLVDDHPVVRAGVRALLESTDDLVVVGEASNSAGAVLAVEAERPDVVLMDLSLGEGEGGIVATARIRALPDPPAVLVLTTYDSESDILRALDAGAAGYLLKDAPPDQLFAGIHAVSRGEPALAPSVAAVLMRRAASPEPRMTEREVEVLELLADGLGNRELAKALFVSEATVKSHLSHIYGKLGVDTRAGAVAAAIEQRIIRR